MKIRIGKFEIDKVFERVACDGEGCKKSFWFNKYRFGSDVLCSKCYKKYKKGKIKIRGFYGLY